MGWFGRILAFFDKLGLLYKMFPFQCSVIPGAVAADLLTKSMSGHFLIYFKAIPASQQKH